MHAAGGGGGVIVCRDPPNTYTHGVESLWETIGSPYRGPHVSPELVLTIFTLFKFSFFGQISEIWAIRSKR